MDPESRTRTAIEAHWRASERGDTDVEHASYAADAVLNYPQSGERFRGRATIAASAGATPPIDTSPFCASSAAGTCG